MKILVQIFSINIIASIKNEESERPQSSTEDSPILSNLTLPKENVIQSYYTMLRTGKCLKGPSCPYNHTKENLIKAWQDMFAELKASPFNPNKHLNPGNTKTSYNTPQPKILQCIVEDIATNVAQQSLLLSFNNNGENPASIKPELNLQYLQQYIVEFWVEV